VTSQNSQPGEQATVPDGVPARRRVRNAVLAILIAGVLAAAGIAAAIATRSNHPAGFSPAAQGAVAAAASGSSTTGPVATSVPARAISPGGTSRAGPGTTITTSGPGVSKIRGSGSLLIIPALGVRAPLIPTGAVGAPDTAALTIPSDIHTVGWWDGTVHDGDRTVQEDAPAPGQPGVALIAGHVDSAAAGPGALHDLGTLQIGDQIQVVDSTGHESAWTVDAPPQANLKTQLPPALWVTTGAPRLALVTCGGPFDPATGHYLDNVIVWASQVN
jgi:Sortase domain